MESKTQRFIKELSKMTTDDVILTINNINVVYDQAIKDGNGSKFVKDMDRAILEKQKKIN